MRRRSPASSSPSARPAWSPPSPHRLCPPRPRSRPPASAATAAPRGPDPSTRFWSSHRRRQQGRQQGRAALRQLGLDRGFTIEATTDPSLVNPSDLPRFRAVAFLNTAGDVLDDGAAGRLRGLLPRRRRLRRRRLGDRDRARLAVPDRHPRHPRVRQDRRADGHRQGRRPRARRDQEPAGVLGPHRHLVQLRPPTSAASATCSRPSATRRSPGRATGRRSTPRPAARWAPTTRSPGARTTGRPLASTPSTAPPARPGATPTCVKELVGAIALDLRPVRPRLQRLRRDRARELPADLRRGSAEPERADRLRRPARRHRPRDPDRPPRRRPAPRPGHQLDHAARHHPGLHDQRGRDVRAGGRQQLQHEQVGLPLLLAADRQGREAGRRLDVTRRRPVVNDPATPINEANAPVLASSLSAWDPYVGYFQLSRFKFVDATAASRRTSTSRASSRSCACPTTAVPAATSPATSTSTRRTTCGWSPATTRRPAAATPAASRPFNDMLTNESQTIAVAERDRRHVHAHVRRPDDGADRVPARQRRDRVRARGALEPRRRRGDGHRHADGQLPRQQVASRTSRR